MAKIGYICPTYKATDLDNYTRTALQTFANTTPEGVAVIVDDGTNGWDEYLNSLTDFVDSLSIDFEIYHFQDQGGLTRSWNKGLEICEKLDVTYAIASNNDVLFPENWWLGLVHALENGYSMVGPLSNAAGITAKGKQDVWNYVENYRLTDDESYLNKVCDLLVTHNLGKVVAS
jgi:hypothetical protein